MLLLSRRCISLLSIFDIPPVKKPRRPDLVFLQRNLRSIEGEDRTVMKEIPFAPGDE